MYVPLVDSQLLVHVPSVDLSKGVLVTRCTYRTLPALPWRRARPYSSWAQLFDENADRLDYLLVPDDYRALGRLEVVHPGGTADRPKTIRYYDPTLSKLHPVQRPLSRARVDSFRFADQGTCHWLVQGLTVHRPEDTNVIRDDASDITIDSCLIEQSRQQSVRIRDASHCTIQRCVIRDSVRVVGSDGKPGDTTGIELGPSHTDIEGIRILDNEIYNVGDCIQVTRNPDSVQTVETLIEGNDLYLDPTRYIDETNTTWDENAIDLKVGSDTPESTVIRNNRMWGFRRRAADGALGEIIVIQRFARNVLIENNIMGDAPRGVSDFAWEQPNDWFEPDDSRNVAVRNNQFYAIRAYSNLDESAITKPITSEISFIGNYFSRSDYIAALTPPGYQGEPRYAGNTRVEVGGVQPVDTEDDVPYKDALNSIATAPFGYDAYERKRWTGPGRARGAIPATELRTHEPPDLPPRRIG